jgi:hypothetical protein
LYVITPTSRGYGRTGCCSSGWLEARDAPGEALPGNGELLVKRSRDNQHEKVQREAAVYTYLLPYVPRLRRPAFYGLFRRRPSLHQCALVLSYEGKTLDAYDELSTQAKYVQPFCRLPRSHVEVNRSRSADDGG